MNIHIQWEEPKEFLKLRRISSNERNKSKRILLFIFIAILFFLPNYIIWLYRYPPPTLNVYLYFIFNFIGSFILSAIIVNIRFFIDLLGNTVIFDDNSIYLRGGRQKKWPYKRLDGYRFNVSTICGHDFEVLEIKTKSGIESFCLSDSIEKDEILKMMEHKSISKME